MAVEKRKYFLGIIPGKREPAPPKDVELRSPKLSGGIIGIMVYSSDSLTVFRDSSHQELKQDAINKTKPRVRHTIFSNYKYAWKKD